jgi:hypothetical protein
MIQPREYLRVSMDFLTAPRGTHWLDKGRALCSEVDPELFFPDQGDWASVKRAKELCAACPLLDDCRREGWGEFGTWGGMSERERRGERPAGELCRKGIHDISKPGARLTRGDCRGCHNDRGRAYDARKRAEKEAS